MVGVFQWISVWKVLFYSWYRKTNFLWYVPRKRNLYCFYIFSLQKWWQANHWYGDGVDFDAWLHTEVLTRWGRYLNKCWHFTNWTIGNNFQWNFIQNTIIFMLENVFENGVCKMAIVLSRLEFVKTVSCKILSTIHSTNMAKQVEISWKYNTYGRTVCHTNNASDAHIIVFCCVALQWRHNGRDGVSNHQPHDC